MLAVKTSDLFSTRQLQLELLAEVALAPSVHNIQPGRWYFDGAGRRVFLCADRDRVLPAADPSGHDRMVSLGCQAEGMSIALARWSLRLVQESPSRAAGIDQTRAPLTGSIRSNLIPPALADVDVVAEFRIEEAPEHADVVDAERDDLTVFTRDRYSYRGVFSRQGDIGVVNKFMASEPHATIVSSQADIVRLAKLHDIASVHFMRVPAYLKELYSWMRFRKSDPRYAVDGLNAEAMCLAGIEALAASVILRPRVFAALDCIGLGGLVSEAAQSKSALGMMIFKADSSTPPFEVGRAFYRAWLQLTKSGVLACPMSSSIDYEVTRREVEKLAQLKSGERVVNLLRFGVPPVGYVAPARARLQPEQLLVKD